MTIRSMGVLDAVVLALLVTSTATVTTVYYGLHGPAFHALLILSVVSMAASMCRGQAYRIDRTSKWLAAVFLFYGLVALVSAWQVDFNAAAVDRLEVFIYFVGAVFLIPLLLTRSLRREWFWYAVALAAALSGLYALWEVVQFGPGHRAAGSKGKAIPFGDIATLAAVLSLLGACVYATNKPLRSAALASAAVLGGYASLASQTRGAWLFLPAALVTTIVFLLQRYPRYRRRVLIGGLVVSLAGVALAMGSGQIRGRLDEGVSQVLAYSQGTAVAAGNSMGERLEMWQAALDAFREHPLTGIGIGQLNAYFLAAAQRGELSPAIAQFDQGGGYTHAHSDYVHVLATRGLFGLASLLLLYLVPLGVFIRTAAIATDCEVRAIGYAGVLTLLGYMHFSLSDSVLLFRMTAGYFVLLSAWLAALALAPAQSAEDACD